MEKQAQACRDTILFWLGFRKNSTLLQDDPPALRTVYDCLKFYILARCQFAIEDAQPDTDLNPRDRWYLLHHQARIKQRHPDWGYGLDEWERAMLTVLSVDDNTHHRTANRLGHLRYQFARQQINNPLP